ncbi:uncharacterized protein LOC133297904 [Gastrolobium bilobum]|uniref:uncharacterized protein LOC133297904 n=1 Tax=Gastrolobium bilobum TaxID=150636 RepID=UPI002AB1AD78|nr:uncharacterized protein LOC133297904 [Gastrolobium bilobum]
MEEPVKEQLSAAASSSGNSARPKLQRYGLRSATKSKEEKSDTPNCSNSSASIRGRNASSVSKSVGVIDFSGKDKSGSAKPPRRFSIPSKASATPGPKVAGNITPISETRTGRTNIGQSRSKTTPISEISKKTSSSIRIKSNLLISASYWLNQIKLSESASKHSISLGFFKLALEAGCEPLRSMQEGLKSYVSRHQLADLEEPVKELFERYNISENTEQLQVSETISQVPEEGTRSSDDDVNSSSSTMGIRKLKPKCLNIDSTQQLTPATESTKEETSQKGNPGSRIRGSSSTNSTTPRPALHSGNRRSVKKLEKPSKQETSKEKGTVKKHGKKSAVKEVPVSTPKGNKENMDSQTTEEITITEIV